MYGGRMMGGQPSAVRKPRMDGKPSMLPKPTRGGSTDRASMDARRPSTSHRSSSADPPRSTIAGVRLSREASASKVPLNRKSRPQYGQAATTPLRSTQYGRATTTPIRTPTEERQTRTWQASVDRALSFVTIKDQRPISNAAWQRAEINRVSGALSARGGAGAGGGAAPLVRPLTIARFVDICGGLLSTLMPDAKLNNDNYVAKLPHLSKRFLYPGVVSKSWLKTVNTLHAFPHALAFIAYFLDLADHVETPVSDEWLYVAKDEKACLRRDYLQKSWIRFQEPGHTFDDLVAEYLHNLKNLSGYDEQHLQKLQENIEEIEAKLEDPSEAAARAEEERLRARRDALLARGKAARAARGQLHARADDERARRDEQNTVMKQLDNDINNITAEIQQLKRELETQDITVADRARLLDEVDYATRVIDSKRTLAEQVYKITMSKEAELAQWQKRTLDACVEYKQGLIHLAARCPPLAALAVDERELMESSCAAAVSRAVDTLRDHHQQLAAQRSQRARDRKLLHRQYHQRLEEIKAKIDELKASIAVEQQALDAEMSKETSEASAWAGERERLAARLSALRASEDAHARALAELDFWETQDRAWTARLSEMAEYTVSLRADLDKQLESERRRRADTLLAAVGAWHRQLDALEAAESDAEKTH